MGQICKLPTVTPQIDIQQDAEEQQQITENNQSSIHPPNQFTMQLSCTPELVIQPQQSKQFSQQDSQYTPEFLAISQPFQM